MKKAILMVLFALCLMGFLHCSAQDAALPAEVADAYLAIVQENQWRLEPSVWAANYYHFTPLDVGFVLWDVTGDGVPELLCIAPDDPEYPGDGITLSIWSCRDGALKRIFHAETIYADVGGGLDPYQLFTTKDGGLVLLGLQEGVLAYGYGRYAWNESAGTFSLMESTEAMFDYDGYWCNHNGQDITHEQYLDLRAGLFAQADTMLFGNEEGVPKGNVLTVEQALVALGEPQAPQAVSGRLAAEATDPFDIDAFLDTVYVLQPRITEMHDDTFQAGSFTYILEDGQAWITAYTGDSNEVYIPTEVDGYAVVGIGEAAFEYAFFNAYLTIPDTVTRMGQNPFRHCSVDIYVSPNHPVYETIDGVLFDTQEKRLIYHPPSAWDAPAIGYTIPQGVLHIDQYAFASVKLQAVTLPDGLRSIGDHAFFVTDNTHLIYIPSSVTDMGHNPFRMNRTTIIVDPDNPVFRVDHGVLFDTQRNRLIRFPTYESGNYTIPDGVVIIDNAAFQGNWNLTGITIPNSVTRIGDFAFEGCIEITSVSIPDSVTHIGQFAFGSCWALAHIAIPSSISTIGKGVFYGTRLSSVVIPDSVTSIGPYAFADCSYLIDAIVPRNAVIADDAFADSWQVEVMFSDITHTAQIPENRIPTSVKNFRYEVWEGQTTITGYNGNVTDLVIPSELGGYPVASIGKESFLGDKGLITLVIEEGVKYIGPYAFEGCANLMSVTIPDSVISIGWYAFSECVSLTDIALPDNGIEVEDYAFANCTWLASAAVPRSAFISETAFEGCPRLTIAHSTDDRVDLGGGTAGTFTAGDYTYYLLRGEAIITRYAGNTADLVIPSQLDGYPVTTIESSAFSSSENLVSLMIPEGVTRIGRYAFSYNPDLVRVILPSSVTVIEASAFANCGSLASITIPDGVTSIGDFAFSGCTSLTDVVVPRSAFIGENVFLRASQLALVYPDGSSAVTAVLGTRNVSSPSDFRYSMEDGRATLIEYNGRAPKVAIPDEFQGYPVVAIGDSVFRYREDITQVAIPNGITSIGKDAFYYCTGLVSINLPDTIAFIGESAFGYCSSLVTITIPDGVTSISDRLFAECTGLVMVTMSNNVTEIGARAFAGCTKLSYVPIPPSVTSIGSGAFMNCSQLVSVHLPEGLVFLSDIFEKCINLTSVTIPSSVAEIHHFAFFHCEKLERIDVAPENRAYASVDGILFDVSLETLIRYPAGRDALEYSVPASVTSIERAAFSRNSRIASVTIPEGATSIGDQAFLFCDGLISATIPHSVESMGFQVFEGCDLLTLTVPAGSYAEQHARNNRIPYISIAY